MSISLALQFQSELLNFLLELVDPEEKGVIDHRAGGQDLAFFIQGAAIRGDKADWVRSNFGARVQDVIARI